MLNAGNRASGPCEPLALPFSSKGMEIDHYSDEYDNAPMPYNRASGPCEPLALPFSSKGFSYSLVGLPGSCGMIMPVRTTLILLARANFLSALAYNLLPPLT